MHFGPILWSRPKAWDEIQLGKNAMVVLREVAD